MIYVLVLNNSILFNFSEKQDFIFSFFISEEDVYAILLLYTEKNDNTFFVVANNLF